ncbi:MAG TPA: DinB family protein [Bryobacteraceae bacterium]|jgi:uncharacterized damage-inducible protein DinB
MMKTILWISLIGAALALPLGAQPAAGMTLTAMLKQPYDLIKSNLMRAAEAMPEENYLFRPVPAEMSYGQWVAHIADSMTRYCGAAMSKAETGEAASKTSKADLVAALKASFGRCDTAFGELTDANALEMVGPAGTPEKVARAGMLAYVNTHNNEGYGSMAVYLRLKGIVPPSSQRANQK